MRRAAASSFLALFALACTPPATSADQGASQTKTTPEPDADPGADPDPSPDAPPPIELAPKPERATPPVIREDLVASDLPAVPSLEAVELETASSGAFNFPEGSDELAPRSAVALGQGLLLAGQAYLERVPGRTSQSWRWLGVVPSEGQASSTRLDPGAIRVGVSDGHGGALLTGVRGTGFDMRGWVAAVDSSGALTTQVDLDSGNQTEMFAVLPGTAAEGELALVAGYVDAQGWLVSLDPSGGQRWHKYLSSYGYTQIRDLARIGDATLVIGSRAQAFGEPWAATVPKNGGKDPSPEDATQHKPEIAGADQNQALRALVSLGDAGFVALGTAKRNYIQDHDQLIGVGLDQSGAPTWTKTFPELRVTEVVDGRSDTAQAKAQFVVAIPGPTPEAKAGLALVEIDGQGNIRAREIAESRGLISAGFVDGDPSGTLLSYAPTSTGIQWQRQRVTTAP